MKISVVIPTYNSSALIEMTLDSVLRQTVPPDEILVLDDGSTDDTIDRLRPYQPRVTVLQQENQGVAAARNVLVRRATGDCLAFLDHDDLWHPCYLETQRRVLRQNSVAASFVGHVDFQGYGHYEWPASAENETGQVEVIEPLSFVKRYNQSTGLFGSMSFCCIPKHVLAGIGDDPFRISGVDDSYLCSLLPLFGPVAYTQTPLVAYRITREAQSANRLKALRLWVQVFELLEGRYASLPDAKLHEAFKSAFAAKRRWYGKLLMGAGNVAEARHQFGKAARHAGDFSSFAKSLALLGMACLPARVQPAWPAGCR